MHRTTRLASLVGLLGAEAGAVATLERLGRVRGFALPQHAITRHALTHWALHAPTEDLIAVTARLTGLVLAWWLLATTALSTARRVVPGCRRLSVLDALTPAALRHALDRVLALGIGASLGLASLHAAGAATLDVPVPRVPVPATTPAASTTGDSFVVVRPGDNLWVIATRVVRAAGQPTHPIDVAPYWRRVVAANAQRLRSRDVNLIFPGERIVLPPNEAARG